jgi:hypothetical protein
VNRSQSRRWPKAGVIALVVVAVGGVVGPRLVGDRSGDRHRVSATAISPAASSDGDGDGDETATVAAPTSASWGVPVGYPRSVAGVRAAAVGWVAALSDLMGMGPIARADTLRELLSQRAYTETMDDVAAERDRFRAEFGRDLSQGFWIDAPLAVEIVESAPERAVVEVWSALLFGMTTERVEVLWRTQAVTLVWERGSWRVDDVTGREGPTPVPAATALPSSGSEFEDVAGWRPAVLAGTSSD